MGFFDNILRAAKNIDKIANDVKSAVDSIQDTAPAAKPVSAERLTPANVLDSGNTPIAPYKTAEGWGFEEIDGEDTEYRRTYEIPEDFEKFNSHAEPTMCYLYKFDDGDREDINLHKPIVCITPEFCSKIEEFKNIGTISGAMLCEPVSMGKMLFRAKIREGKKTVYFYGFEQGESKRTAALALFYMPDVEGTPLESKLMKILDHCAETYTEIRE